MSIRQAIALAFVAPMTIAAALAQPALQGVDADPVRSYIHRAWPDLTRTERDMPRAAADPKLGLPPGEAWPVYVAAGVDRVRISREIEGVLGPEGRRQVDLRTLPRSRKIARHGLLYLPHPYVVPGGRFNEMYGWDSFFIQLGLMRDGRQDLARAMVDNFVYEIEHYGTLLNANRTYYLTRSQPPFLSRMVLMLYDADHDRAALARVLPALEAYYRSWTRPPHALRALGLARYYDSGEGPAPEVVSGERDADGRTHYERVREYYRTHEVPDYDVRRFYDREHDRLTALFYKGDRAMRESGFDPSNRFGPFGADALHYAPVCLNSLLYQFELDMARIHDELGDANPAKGYRARAAARRIAVDRYLWDEARGLYLDYNFETRRRRDYVFAATFYPLWVGLASPQQARRARDEGLRQLEADHGLLTSARETGSQWDAPYGWAPLQWIAVEGLRRYGFTEDADRLSRKFVETVRRDFDAHGVIVEKYDVLKGKSDIAAGLRFGYTTNEVGFGWTNGVYLDLTSSGPPERQVPVACFLSARLSPKSSIPHISYEK